MGLPRDLPAAVLIVLHMAPNAPRSVAKRLDDLGMLHASWATEAESVESGRIYVAPPDRHLIVENRRLRLTRGPRENYSRPSIDVLFRSVAHEYGSRVIGVILTGRLDDGTAGLWSIKDRGGIAMVQLPEDAAYPSMPQSALRHVDVDYKLAVRDMPAVLASLVREGAPAGEAAAPPNEQLEVENRIALGQVPLEAGLRSVGKASLQTCPECHGSMVAINEGDVTRFRCHTGHAFTPAALVLGAAASIESTLWSALAQLEQYQMLLTDLKQNPGSGADALTRRSAQLGVLIQRVRELALHPALTRDEDPL